MNYNGFPIGYQPTSPQYYPQQPNFNQTNAPQISNSVIWVQGMEGAKSYLVAPNSVVHLWDSENPVIYVKSADASGIPSIKIIDYKYRDDTEHSNKEYITQNDLNKFKRQLLKELKEGKHE